MSTPITGKQLSKILEILEGKGVTSPVLQREILEKGILSDLAEAAVRDTIPSREEFRKSLGLCNPRFQLLNSFPIVVPDEYVHATRLRIFKERYKSEFCFYHEELTDENFAKVTTQLVSGQKFTVKVFQINRAVTSEDCLAHMRSQKAVLVGAHGVSLAYEQGKEQLPTNRWSVSLDEKDALWKDSGGYRRVPYVYRDSDGFFRFILGYFELDWLDYFCLLCFCDLSE